MIRRSTILQRSPLFYGLSYLISIPIFAALYFFCPIIIGDERSYIECLYFSTVTITTLGYGDITPLGELGQVVTASESLLGVIFIGLFLNAIAGARSDTVREKQAEKETAVYRESQRARLNGHYSLIQPLVARFRESVIQITQTADKDPGQYDPNFTLSGMKDMYKPTRLLREPYLRPAIQGYFEAVEDLQEEMCDLIKGVDLRCFPEIEGHSLNVVSAITGFDYSGAILSASNTTAGDKTLADFAVDQLANYDGNYVPQGSNILDGYILLYHQVKFIMKSIAQLEQEVENELRPPEQT